MAGQYMRLADSVVITTGLAQDRDQVVDVGAYRQVLLHARVLRTGSGGSVKIQHAATNEGDAWEDLYQDDDQTAVTWALTGTGDVQSSSKFLRYLRWAASGTVSGGPVRVTIDLVAKE